MDLEVLTEAGDPLGERPPVLFVHGVCHGAWCWKSFLGRFAQAGIDAHAVSLRGHGGSAGRERLDVAGLADYVDDVRQVVRALDRAPVIVGHSMGGAILQKYLAAHDHTVVGAVFLASAIPGGLGTWWMLRTAVRNRPSALRAGQALTEGRRVSLETLAAAPFFSGRLDRSTLEMCAASLQAESRKATTELRSSYAATYDVDVPVMVLGSRGDKLFPASDVRRTASAYHVKPVLLDDMCHDMMLDPNWPEVADLILGFVEGLNPR